MSRARDLANAAGNLAIVTGASSGTVVNEKSVVYGASGEVNATTLQVAGAAISASPTEINTLDALSRGSLLYGNASGETSVLATGTADQILKSDGTDVAWGDAAAGGSFTLLNTYNTTSGSTVDVEDIDATYDSYMVVLAGVHTTNTGRNLALQLKIAGGYMTTAYSFSLVRQSSGLTYNANNSGDYIEFCGVAGLVTSDNPSERPYDGIIWLHNANTSSKHHGVHFSGSAAHSHNSTNWGGCGYHHGATAGVVTGIRIYNPDLSDTFVGGSIKIYGLTK